MDFIVVGSGGGSKGLQWPDTPWPITEAEVIAGGYPNNVVWDFDGSGNETGVPGQDVSLTGADLVLPDNGGFPASSGGWRTKVKNTNYSFGCTQQALDMIMQPTGGGALFQLRNLDLVANQSNYLNSIHFFDNTENLYAFHRWYIENRDSQITTGPIIRPQSELYRKGVPKSKLTSFRYITPEDFPTPTATTFWLVFAHYPVEVIGGATPLFVYGIKAGSQPHSVPDLDVCSIIEAPLLYDRNPASTDSIDALIGFDSLTYAAAGFGVKSLTFGQLPFGMI